MKLSKEVIRHEIKGQKIKEEREKIGISQETLANIAGWTQPYQSRLETGYIQVVSAETMETLLKALKRARRLCP